MLFTTPAFFWIYLPIVLIGYYLLGRFSVLSAATWLFVASVAFYGYWMPEFVLLLLASIAWNYWVGSNIGKLDLSVENLANRRFARYWLIAGISVDLAALAYFKYAGFFISNINALFGMHWNIGEITLPIGISFFTFTQIAFLADAYLKGTKEYTPVHFGLFVTYFPHLIAGPVLHHAQMMPQFKEAATYKLHLPNVSAGLLIFAIGLFKKIVIADGISPYADAVFDASFAGQPPDAIEAWIGALAYTFQLYFDFSGYSDMAIGLSWMFNVRLPYNFDSPYRALNISDFWRRWHMTLSAFLRDYLYIPLGGNKKGPIRRYINLMVTMILGGLWHGASWTFVFWGTLHGVYLVINHAFQKLTGQRMQKIRDTRSFEFIAWALTFFSAVIAWVFFRANDFPSALRVLSGLFALNSGAEWSSETIHTIFWNQGLDTLRGVYWLAVLSIIAFLMPNSNRIGELALNKCRDHATLVPTVLGAALTSCVFLVLINGTRTSVSAFIYFNF